MPSALSAILLKFRSRVWLPPRHINDRRSKEVKEPSRFGLEAPPQTTRTNRGRREGRQADATAIDVSAAVQMAAGTK